MADPDPHSPFRVLEQADRPQVAAALEVMYLMACADGSLEASELRTFLQVARQVSGLELESLNGLVSEWKARAPIDLKQRLTELRQCLETPELRRAAYDLAAQVATADGRIEDAEMATLDLIEETLKVV